MAIKLSTISDGTIEVIARIDNALPQDLTSEEYDNYLESLDESLLRIGDEDKPTRFVMRKILPWALAQKAANQRADIEKGEVKIKLSFMAVEVKYALVDIKNPEDLPEEDKIKFERSSEGGASETLMEKLMAAGIVDNLFSARQHAITKTKDRKKN